MRPTRRQFLQASGSSLGSLAFLSQLRPVSAQEAKLDPARLRADDGIEPTIRLLEETPREKLIEEVAHRVKNGLSYRELLASLLLAGVRNVQPRPQVGFKFHAVLVINSAHLASLASPDSDRWLPIFWAIDRFKSAQNETLKTSGWRMGKVDEAKVPAAHEARKAFRAAMDAWNEESADAAAAAVARYCGRDDAFELFARYGCRDWRDIGHKAIYVSNAFRTLDSIGWHHAEPVLRSLAYALMKYDGESPAKADHDADRPGRRNRELLKDINPTWQEGKNSRDATTHLLSVFRTAADADAPKAVVEALNDGVGIESVWDAILAASGELLMRRPGIVSLHSVTSSNALRYAHSAAGDPSTRLLLLLQNASFLPLFRGALGNDAGKGNQVDTFEPAEAAPGEGAVDEIFAAASHDRTTAARKALAYLDHTHAAEDLIRAARRLVFLKGNDAHDYKFSSAVLEDYYNVSPQWRNRFLATSLFYLPGNDQPDNALVSRIRAALSV